MDDAEATPAAAAAAQKTPEERAVAKKMRELRQTKLKVREMRKATRAAIAERKELETRIETLSVELGVPLKERKVKRPAA